MWRVILLTALLQVTWGYNRPQEPIRGPVWQVDVQAVPLTSIIKAPKINKQRLQPYITEQLRGELKWVHHHLLQTESPCVIPSCCFIGEYAENWKCPTKGDDKLRGWRVWQNLPVKFVKMGYTCISRIEQPHGKCRTKYINVRSSRSSESSSNKKRPRLFYSSGTDRSANLSDASNSETVSDTSTTFDSKFNWKGDCILCMPLVALGGILILIIVISDTKHLNRVILLPKME